MRRQRRGLGISRVRNRERVPLRTELWKAPHLIQSTKRPLPKTTLASTTSISRQVLPRHVHVYGQSKANFLDNHMMSRELHVKRRQLTHRGQVREGQAITRRNNRTHPLCEIIEWSFSLILRPLPDPPLANVSS